MRRKSLFSINGLTSVRRCGTLGLLALFVEAGSGFKRATAQQADLEPKTILGQEDSRSPKTAYQQARSEQQKPSSENNRPKRGEFVIAPLPISSPALGTGLVPALGYIFPLSKNDSVSPPSAIAGAGLITNNGRQAFAIAGDFYLKRDTHRATTVCANGNLNYNLYGIGTAAGNDDLKLPLEQTGQVLFGEGLRRIGCDFYLGLRFISGNSRVAVRPSGADVPPPPDIGLDTTLRSFGVHLLRDTRPNRFYPRRGMFLNFTADFFSEDLGSKYSFQLGLPWRFGVIGFGGIGEVVPGADQLLKSRNCLPAGGGTRFLLSKKYHVNLRADAAIGNSSHTWALGVGEAF